MKIAVISDPHLGFSTNSRTDNDSYENFREAIEKSLDCDLILIGGDIFDSKNPNTHVFSKALEILALPTLEKNPGIRLVKSDKELKKSSVRTLEHIPVVAIHGNHEFKSKNDENALEALENAGVLIYLKRNKITFEKDDIRVTIHGMSYVPERYAKYVLDEWNPKPEEGYNILMLHQNIDPYVFSPLEPPTIDISSLPSGFDIIIDGHIHMNHEENINKTKFIIPGSTVITQLQPSEADVPKGFYKIEISGEKIITNFIKLENQRKFFYETVKIEKEEDVKEIEKKIREILVGNFKKDPLIKIKILGRSDLISKQDLRMLEKKYSSRAIVIFSESFESPELAEKVEFLKGLKEGSISLEEIGIKILEKNLKELGFKQIFDFEEMFNLLSEGDVDLAIKKLVGEKEAPLDRFVKQ